jgi:hypothetical protein
MKTTKNLILILALIIGMTFFISCEKEDVNPIDITENPIDTTENPVDTTTNPDDTTTNPVGYTRTYVHTFDFTNISTLEIFKQADGTVDSIYKYNVNGDTTFITPDAGYITMVSDSKSAKFSAIESIETVGDYMRITADFTTIFKSAGTMSTVMVEKETGIIENVTETSATSGEYVVIPNNDWTWVDNAGVTVTFSDDATGMSGTAININNAEIISLLVDNNDDIISALGEGINSPSNFSCNRTFNGSNGILYGILTYQLSSSYTSDFVTIITLKSGSSLSIEYIKTTKHDGNFNVSLGYATRDNSDMISAGFIPDQRSVTKGSLLINYINSGISTNMVGYILAPSFNMYNTTSKTFNVFTNYHLAGTADDQYRNKITSSKMILFGDYMYLIINNNGSNYVSKIQISSISRTQLNTQDNGSKIITTAIDNILTTTDDYFILTSGTTNYIIYEDGSMVTSVATEEGDVIDF